MWAASCMQGWRTGMEDAHICLTLPGNVSMFGVLDGHGGEEVARFCQRHLPEECASSLSHRSLGDSLTHSFHRMDELLRDSPAEVQSLSRNDRRVDVDMVGCTSCVTCVTDTGIIVANAGDSRAVLSRRGLAVALSEDHKPNNPIERQRITDAGGFIETQSSSTGPVYRVNGNLNLSRALGDLFYKKDATRGPEAQIISGTPDITCTDRSDEDEFIVICCDGVWDVKSNQEVVDFVRGRLATSREPRHMSRILEDLLDACISPDLSVTRGLGGDNMTAILVCFPRAVIEPKVEIRDSTAPFLLGVKRKVFLATEGVLVVRLAIPAAWALGSFCFDVSEETSLLEVRASGFANPWKFGMQEYLPAGARFIVSQDPAKFHPKSQTLRARLPWRLP